MGADNRVYEHPYLYWEKNSWYLYGVHYCEKKQTLCLEKMALIRRIIYMKKFLGYDEMKNNVDLTQILKEYEGLLGVAK